MLTRTTPLGRWLEKMPNTPRDVITMVAVKLGAALERLDERHQKRLEQRRRGKLAKQATANRIAADKAARVALLARLKEEDEQYANEMTDLIDSILTRASKCAELLKEKRERQPLGRANSVPDRIQFDYVSFTDKTGGFLWVTADAEILIDRAPLDLSSLHYRDLTDLDGRIQRKLETLS